MIKAFVVIIFFPPFLSRQFLRDPRPSLKWNFNLLFFISSLSECALRSISPTFYECIFCTKVFSVLRVRLWMNFGTKNARVKCCQNLLKVNEWDKQFSESTNSKIHTTKKEWIQLFCYNVYLQPRANPITYILSLIKLTWS